MPAEIETLGGAYRVENGWWAGPDAGVAELLNSTEADNRSEYDAPLGADPSPDYTSARLMVRRYGGRVLTDPPAPAKARPADDQDDRTD